MSSRTCRFSAGSFIFSVNWYNTESMQENIPQFSNINEIEKTKPILESFVVENIKPETLEYATKLVKEEKINNSYKVIDPKEIHFVTEHHKEFTDGEGDDREYLYGTIIDGKKYKFVLHVINGHTSGWDEENEEEITNSYNCGRIDFSAEGSEFITNLGLEKIHKTDELIKDLFKFIYSKNNATYLIVDASKLDLTLPKSEEEAIDQVRLKINQLKENLIENIHLNEFYFPENSEKLYSVSINNNEVKISHINGQTEVVELPVFLEKLESPQLLKNSVLRNTIAVLLSDISAGGNKKQQQRLNLYERRLKKIGFSIDRKEDRIYADVTNALLENLYDFSSLPNDTQQLLKKYISETGNKNPTITDLRAWKYPNSRRGGRLGGRGGSNMNQ